MVTVTERVFIETLKVLRLLVEHPSCQDGNQDCPMLSSSTCTRAKSEERHYNNPMLAHSFFNLFLSLFLYSDGASHHLSR